MNNLLQIPIIRQRHPGMSPVQPFDIIGEYHYGPMANFEGDMHYALQFCVIMEGGMELMFDNFRREFFPGEACWTMFWEPHAYRFTGRRNYVVTVNIDIDYLGSCDPFRECNWLLPFVLQPEQRYCPSNAAERTEMRLNAAKLLKFWQQRSINWKLQGWLLIHQMIMQALSKLTPHNSGNGEHDLPEFSYSFKKIKAAVDMVRKTAGRPPTLEEAAAACNLSPSRFSDVFRQNLGVSYGKFATRARLASAAKELKNATMAIEEIAEKWGFFDSSHFCHSFKKLYGCSPKQYQQAK